MTAHVNVSADERTTAPRRLESSFEARGAATRRGDTASAAAAGKSSSRRRCKASVPPRSFTLTFVGHFVTQFFTKVA